MTQSTTPDEVINKWEKLLGPMDESKKNWMSEYASKHDIYGNIQPGDMAPGTGSIRNSDLPLLPIAMRIAAQTIGQDLVSVKPMSGVGISIEEQMRIDQKIKQENRDRKIKSVMDDVEYVEKKVLTEEEYKEMGIKNPPKGNLLYIDYKYGGTSSKI